MCSRTFFPQNALCLLQDSLKHGFPLRSLRVSGEMSPWHSVICNLVHSVVTDTGDVFSLLLEQYRCHQPFLRMCPGPSPPEPPLPIVLPRNAASSNFLSLSALCQAARRADGVTSLGFCAAEFSVSFGLSCKLMSLTIVKYNR